MIQAFRSGGRKFVRCDVCGMAKPFEYDHQVQSFAAQHAAHTTQSRGLGDLVASGIKKLTGIQPCAPCARRAAQLNSMTPWRRR